MGKKQLNNFDNELKKFYISKYNQSFGYKKNEKIYEVYQENDEYYEAFVKEMEEEYNDIYLAYKNGDGNELLETSNPPKMASSGSSSRFAYYLFRKIKGKKISINNIDYKVKDILFEGKLKAYEEPTKTNGKLEHKPNIDVILICENTLIFIEVKSREIYYDKYDEISVGYKNNIKKSISLNKIFETANEKNNKLDLKYINSNNEKVNYDFDMKQTICHLIGISNFVTRSDDNSYYINKSLKYEGQDIILCHMILNPLELNVIQEVKDTYNRTITNIDENKSVFEKIYNELTGEMISYYRIDQYSVENNCFDFKK